MSTILGLEKLHAGWLAAGFACCTYTYAGGLRRPTMIALSQRRRDHDSCGLIVHENKWPK